jgi:hypothetical protein
MIQTHTATLTNRVKPKIYTPSKAKKIEVNTLELKRNSTMNNFHSEKKTDLAQCIKNTKITLDDLSDDKEYKEIRVSRLEIDEEKNINISLDSTLNVQDILFMSNASFNKSNIFEKSFLQSVNQNRLTACWISISR